MNTKPTTDLPTRELLDFRQSLYNVFPRWRDALFELSDSLLSQSKPFPSLPYLSLHAPFRRSHGSLYRALREGELDDLAFRRLLVTHRHQTARTVLAVDSSTWPKSDAECSPERGYYYSASRHSNGQPIQAGWSYSWISQLNGKADSWTVPLDVMRIPPSTTLTAATVTQVARCLTLLAPQETQPLVVFDAGYDPIALTYQLRATKAELLVRLRSDRVFYTDQAPQAPGTNGRPRRHGQRFVQHETATWPAPEFTLQDFDPRYGQVKVEAWSNLHPRLGARGE